MAYLKLERYFIDNNIQSKIEKKKHEKYENIYNQLKNDVKTLQCFRKTVNIEQTKYPFLLTHINNYIFTGAAIQLLQERYLNKGENIQEGFARIASYFCDNSNVPLWRNIYKCLSATNILVSSVIARYQDTYSSSCATAAGVDCDEDVTTKGKACLLAVMPEKYNEDALRLMWKLFDYLAKGIGIGLCVDNVPKYGSEGYEYIKGGINEFLDLLSRVNGVRITKRESNFAVYISIYRDTLYDVLNIRQRNKNRLLNVFPAVKIPNMFMKKVRNNEAWYLFDVTESQLLDKTKNEKEFEELYETFVSEQKYTDMYESRKIFKDIIKNILMTGSPYIIFIDNVNKFNNTKHLGKIKTLNLCSEITNYCNEDAISTCLLLSVNVANFKHQWDLVSSLENILSKEFNVNFKDDDFVIELDETSKLCWSYCKVMGFLATVCLNHFLGSSKRREIGVSPLGVYDAIIISKTDHPLFFCKLISESLYKGCVLASVAWSKKFGIRCKNFEYSCFSRGEFQFDLRNLTYKNLSDWNSLKRDVLLYGMANSLLTCQAPTATTSLLADVTPSVTEPHDCCDFICREHSFRSLSLSYVMKNFFIKNNVEMINFSKKLLQLKLSKNLYKVSLPYIDQSQSVILNGNFSSLELMEYLIYAYNNDFKTALYYINLKSTGTSMLYDDTKKENEICDSCSL